MGDLEQRFRDSTFYLQAGDDAGTYAAGLTEVAAIGVIRCEHSDVGIVSMSAAYELVPKSR